MVLFSLARALVLTKFRLFTLKDSKTIELRVVTQVKLNGHATNARACDIFGHRFRFDALRPH